MNRRSVVITVLSVFASVGVPAGYAAAHDDGPKPALYLVGGGVESINPTPDMLANDDFYLGGYGFSSGHPGNVTALPSVTGGRFATGILGDGVHSRAFAISDATRSNAGPKSTIILAQIETQGYFNAYKQGPFGENEIRQDAAACIKALAAGTTSSACPATVRPVQHHKHDVIAPAPTSSQILVDSDHSHGGPDTAGVWGGVPTSYLKEVHDQTVQAIVDAWQSMRLATVTYGIAHAGVSGNNGLYPPQECIDAGHKDANGLYDCNGVANADWLLHNQFSTDPNNLTMDDEIRVFQARDAGDPDKVLATYVNYASHPTVLGSDNTLVTGDYVGRLDLAIQNAFGGFGMDQVGTLGREQPERASCTDPSKTTSADQNLCALDQYAARVLVKIKDAINMSQPLTGNAVVAMNSYYLSDTTTNGVLLGGEYAGQAIGAPFARANTAPWYTGTQLGTSYFVGRIGPVLITGGPGEMYAQIWQKVKDTVTADPSSGITSVLNIGTAGDFLGYIIAPLEAYPQPMEASLVSTGNSDCSGVPEPAGVCPDPIGNDNYFFNVSHTFGERLTCDFLRGAGDIVAGDPQKYWSTYNRCPAFVNDLVTPEGFDMSFPQQPDLSSLPPYQHM